MEFKPELLLAVLYGYIKLQPLPPCVEFFVPVFNSAQSFEAFEDVGSFSIPIKSRYSDIVQHRNVSRCFQFCVTIPDILTRQMSRQYVT